MTHPDPYVQEIRDRNAQAVAEAVHAPPRDIADDPAAYLRWAQNPPQAPPAKPPRPFVSVQPRSKAAGYVPTPPRHDERNRQLNALQKLIDQDQQATPEEDRT
jgi:hypothetical protein